MKTPSFFYLKNPKLGIASAAIAFLLTSCYSAQAALYWDADGTLAWSTAGNWYTDAAGTTVSGTAPTSSDDVFFNTTPDIAKGGTVTFSASTNFANSITFDRTVATTLSQNGSTKTLTIGGGGVTLNSGAGSATLGVSTNSLLVEASADQTWTNNDATALLSSRRIGASNTAAGPVTITFSAASSGGISTSFGLTNSPDTTKSLAVVVDSAGTGNVSLTGGGTFSGGTTIKRGLLTAGGDLGVGPVSLGNTSGSADARLDMGGNISNNLTIQSGSSGNVLSLTSNSSTGRDFTGTITLNNNLTVGSLSSSSRVLNLKGDISGSGNLTVGRLVGGSSNPTVSFSGNNSYTGKTTIESATVVVNSLKNVNGGNSSLGAVTNSTNGTITMSTVAASTLRYTGTGDTTDRVIEIASNSGATLDQSGTGNLLFTANVLSSGTGSRTLTLRGATAGTGEISGVLDNAVANLSVTKTDSGTWRLSNAANTYAGTTSISGGVLEVVKLANTSSASSIGTGSIGPLSITGGTLRYIGSGDSTNRTFQVNNLGATVDASGTGAVNFTRTTATTHPTNNLAIAITLTGTNTDLNTWAANDTNNGSGAVSYTKDGVGTWALTGANTYTGATTVNAGTLLINGSTAAGSAVTVNGGTLGGTGTIAGTVTVNSGGTLSPGASIESLATGSNTWNGGGALDFEFSTDGSTGSAGTQWDLLTITGGLDLSGASSVTPFTMNLFTMADATTPGVLASWDPDVTHTWAGFVTTTTGFTAFAANKFAINATGFQNPVAGTFSVVQNGNNLDLVYSAIPEPSTWALLAFSLTTVIVLRRRRA